MSDRNEALLGLASFLTTFLGTSQRKAEQESRDRFNQNREARLASSERFREKLELLRERRYSDEARRLNAAAEAKTKASEAEAAFRTKHPYSSAAKDLGASYSGIAGLLRTYLDKGVPPQSLLKILEQRAVDLKGEEQRLLTAAGGGGEAGAEDFLPDDTGKPLTTSGRLAAVQREMGDMYKAIEVMTRAQDLGLAQTRGAPPPAPPAKPYNPAPSQALGPGESFGMRGEGGGGPPSAGNGVGFDQYTRDLMESLDAGKVGASLNQGQGATPVDQAMAGKAAAAMAQIFATQMNRAAPVGAQIGAWQAMKELGIQPAPRWDWMQTGTQVTGDTIKKWNGPIQGPPTPAAGDIPAQTYPK